MTLKYYLNNYFSFSVWPIKWDIFILNDYMRHFNLYKIMLIFYDILMTLKFLYRDYP